MKKMSWGRFFVFVLSVSLVASACSKAKDGTNGTNGAPGATGTANVIYSAWTDLTFSINSDSSAYIATITAPKLADSIIAKGDIKVYMNLNSTTAPAITPLPYSEIYNGDLYYVYPVFQTQKITLVADADFSSYSISGVKYGQFRYIIIPGGVSGGRSSIDWKDYQQVKAYLGLKD
jgi:hypothetical protein